MQLEDFMLTESRPTTATMSHKLILPALDTPVIRTTERQGLFGVRRWLRAKWRCYRQTALAHEVDLHTGICRFCHTKVDQRL